MNRPAFFDRHRAAGRPCAGARSRALLGAARGATNHLPDERRRSAFSPDRGPGRAGPGRLLGVGVLLAIVGGCASAPVEEPSSDQLRLYFIDVEGGQSTLMVSPSGQSLLVDTGWSGNDGRDADRIAATIRAAGVTELDYLVITHYHDDHVGGLEALANRVKFKRVITHGPNNETNQMAQTLNPIFRAGMTISGAPEIIARPGDVIPIEGLNIQVLTSNRQLIPNPLPGAGAPTPSCATTARARTDNSDNSASVGMLITFGDFRFLDIGDVTQDLEYDLACPVNRIGEVDLYLTTHHGSRLSGNQVLVHALSPRVAIMNNGARKGGDPPIIEIVKTAPGLEDLWMMHFSEAAGAAGNVPEQFIANLTDAPTATGHDAGHGFQVTARRDGSFTVVNGRNGFGKQYSK